MLLISSLEAALSAFVTTFFLYLETVGSTSLITYSIASNFAVFSHMRNLVLQNQLCVIFNTRFAKSSDDEPKEDETQEEAKKRKNMDYQRSEVENP